MELRRRKTSAAEPSFVGSEGVAMAPVLKFALAAYLLGLCALELQNPSSSIQPWNLVFLGGAGLAFLVATLAKGIGAPRLFLADGVFLIYIAYCLLSVSWSVSPSDTLVQSVYAIAAWLVTVPLRRANREVAVRYLLRIAVGIALASFVLAMVSPLQALQANFQTLPELRGVFQHQQRLGLFMGTAIGLLLISVINGDLRIGLGRGRRRALLVLVILLVCWIAALARLNSVFLVLAFFITVGMMRNFTARALSVVALIGAASWALLNLDRLLRDASSDGVDLTLTGRTNVWDRTLIAANDGGQFGWGFSTFTSPFFDGYWGAYRATSAHNSFLQSYFETGALGVGLLCLLILVQLVTAYRAGRGMKRVSYSFFLVLVALLSSLTGVTYAGKPTILMGLVLLFLAIELQERASRFRELGDSSRRSGPPARRSDRGAAAPRASRQPAGRSKPEGSHLIQPSATHGETT